MKEDDMLGDGQWRLVSRNGYWGCEMEECRPMQFEPLTLTLSGCVLDICICVESKDWLTRAG